MMNRIKLLGLLPILLLSSCSLYNDYVYNDEGYAPLSDYSLDLTNIKNLDLNWVGGYISIYQDPEATPSISETRSEYPLYYKIDNDTLSIKFVRPHLPTRILNTLSKDLYIYLPLTFSSLRVEAVSSSIYMRAVEIDEGSFDLVNTPLNAYYYVANKTRIDAVSSEVNFSPLVCYKNDESAYLEHKVDINAIQSSIGLGFAKDCGYIVSWDGIRCTYYSDYNNQKEYGNKLVKVDFEGVKSTLNMNVCLYLDEGEYY